MSVTQSTPVSLAIMQKVATPKMHNPAKSGSFTA